MFKCLITSFLFEIRIWLPLAQTPKTPDPPAWPEQHPPPHPSQRPRSRPRAPQRLRLRITSESPQSKALSPFLFLDLHVTSDTIRLSSQRTVFSFFKIWAAFPCTLPLNCHGLPLRQTRTASVFLFCRGQPEHHRITPHPKPLAYHTNSQVSHLQWPSG